MRVLVTGASGYIGSRLVDALVAAGHDVVATARDPARLAGLEGRPHVETRPLDVLDADSCTAAFAGADVDVVHYLVHAIGEGDFVERDRRGAEHLAAAAATAGVRRLVYLGGFVPDGESLSQHLDSRAETAEVLARSGVPLVWLRAAVVIGAGSTSFEIIRYLADRLPVLPTPEWMSRLVQPVAVDDVLHYLVAASGADAAGAWTLPPGAYDVAGEEVMPYRDLLRRYLSAAGLRRLLVPVRGVTPGLAAGVAGRLTPVPAALTADLVESLRHTMVAGDDRIREHVPDPPGGLTTVDEAMRRALAPAAGGRPDALALAATDAGWAGGDRPAVTVVRGVDAPAATVWERIEGIGARAGYVGWPLPWRVRAVGRRVAGAGAPAPRASARSGGAGPTPFAVGEVLDVLTVEDVDPGHRLRLVTGALGPGTARLELEVDPDGPDRCTLHVRFEWQPRGLPGRAWWAALRPLHLGAFDTLARVLARDAEAATARAE